MEAKVHDILRSELAIFHNEGLQVFQIIAEELKKNSNIKLSFAGIERCSTQFLNAAIGKLYLDFSAQTVDANLTYDYAGYEDIESKIKEVRANALNHEKYNSLIAHVTA